MATKDELSYWLNTLNRELDRRIPKIKRLDDYHDGDHPVPPHVRDQRLETEFKTLMKQATTNFPALIVDSVEERLEVTGFDFDGDADSEAWDIWQRNHLDADAGMVHETALTTGRAYAIVWADADGNPTITPEHPSTTVVAYEVGSNRDRAAALRRWRENDRWMATLYLKSGIYKFQAPVRPIQGPDTDEWEPRVPPGEEWPLANPLGVVPVVEFAVNRSLRPSEFGTSAGEFERVTPIIDRISTTIFAGLLAQAYASYPVRALIGSPIERDEDGKPIPPFSMSVSKIVQIENPDGKLVQLPESDLGNYIRFAETHVRHLAAITKTPSHYLLAGDMVNLSADAIRASEAGLVSKIHKHHRSLGESWEETIRLAFRVVDQNDPRGMAYTAATKWRDPESRSEAERADAAVKLATILPWQALAERVLNATPTEIAEWEAQRAADGLATLMATPTEAPTP
jgi:hypothetical protein